MARAYSNLKPVDYSFCNERDLFDIARLIHSHLNCHQSRTSHNWEECIYWAVDITNIVRERWDSQLHE